MPEVLFIPATRAHAEELAATMRPEDLAEVQAMGMKDALESLSLSMSHSAYSFAVMVDGKVAALLGVAPLPDLPDAGNIWFLTGTVFLANARHLLDYARAALELILAQTGTLLNFIDARYEAAIRLARWLGFTIGEAIPLGPQGLPFHPAVIRRA